ncbi:hypothetical protein OH77DRAFT_1419725 [Trametes cingulata]|nr:hypothetical protein OH77DRAFT_1419725 [Trametes cingulata]
MNERTSTPQEGREAGRDVTQQLGPGQVREPPLSWKRPQVDDHPTSSKRKAEDIPTPSSPDVTKRKRRRSDPAEGQVGSPSADGKGRSQGTLAPPPHGTSSFRVRMPAPAPWKPSATQSLQAVIIPMGLEAAQRCALVETSASSTLKVAHWEPKWTAQGKPRRSPRPDTGSVGAEPSQAARRPLPHDTGGTMPHVADSPEVNADAGAASPSWLELASWVPDASSSNLPQGVPWDNQAPVDVASTFSGSATARNEPACTEEDPLLSDATWAFLNDPNVTDRIPDSVLYWAFHEAQSALGTGLLFGGTAGLTDDVGGDWRGLQGSSQQRPSSVDATHAHAAEFDGQAVSSPGGFQASDLEQSSSLFTPAASPASSASSVEVPLANRYL